MSFAQGILNSGFPPQGRFSHLWKIPSLFAAFALTNGFLLDRKFEPLPMAWWAILAGALFAWGISIAGSWRGLSLVYLFAVLTALGGVRHYYSFRWVSPTDIRFHLKEKWELIRVRGILQGEPRVWSDVKNPLKPIVSGEQTQWLIRVKEIFLKDEWKPGEGILRVTLDESPQGFQTADRVEAIGRVRLIQGPSNPGEWNYREFLAAQGVRGDMRIRGKGLLLLDPVDSFSLDALFVSIREKSRRLLSSSLSGQEEALAEALLLGDSPSLDYQAWDKFRNTGVLHVLAISGQHLAILGGTLMLLLRMARIPTRNAAVAVTLILFFYALLTGGRPSAMRAAIMAGAFSLGTIFRRPAMHAHALAFSWILIALVQPGDLFSPGCLLSFLAVACLIWVVPTFLSTQIDPLDELTLSVKPRSTQLLFWLLRESKFLFIASGIVWLVVTPLAGGFNHVISPVGLLIGPPLIVLTTLALLAGFIALVLGWIFPWISIFTAWVIQPALWLCQWIVDLALVIPFGHFFMPDFSPWLLTLFYLGLFAWQFRPGLLPRWGWLGSLALFSILFLLPWRNPPRELRATFLSVGHGGCVVLEFPTGETSLYDLGSFNGPNIARTKVAPFLWSKGIRRIDRVFLSHADLDHFNALPSLLDYFSINEVIANPTFFEKETPGVKEVERVLRGAKIPCRPMQAGEKLQYGEAQLEALHPPAFGPLGVENVRSLVLLLTFQGKKILLTGDLQPAGLDRVISQSPIRVDILQAPHHGSPASLPQSLLTWANPTLVVACQGENSSDFPWKERLPQQWLSTREEGAITVGLRASGMKVQTYSTKATIVLPSRD